MHFLSEFNLRELLSSFVVLLAITDIPGNLPIVINLQNKGIKISARRAFIYSLVLLVFFFYAGEAFLKLFGLDISSFAIAGALIVFLFSLEMILDINLVCEGTDISGDATFVPVVFPLFVGAGTPDGAVGHPFPVCRYKCFACSFAGLRCHIRHNPSVAFFQKTSEQRRHLCYEKVFRYGAFGNFRKIVYYQRCRIGPPDKRLRMNLFIGWRLHRVIWS